MKRFKLLSLLLVAIMVAGIFAGCGNKEIDSDDDGDTKTSAGVSTDAPAATDGGEEATGGGDGTNVNKESSVFPEKLVAEKIGSVDIEDVNVGNGGLYYSKAGKYGILTPDGKKDTGAVYDYCYPNEQYFEVVTNYAVDLSDTSSLNCVGLVDAEGKVLVPEKYASIDVLNDRFVKVCEVTEKTDNEKEALVY